MNAAVNFNPKSKLSILKTIVLWSTLGAFAMLAGIGVHSLGQKAPRKPPLIAPKTSFVTDDVTGCDYVVAYGATGVAITARIDGDSMPVCSEAQHRAARAGGRP